MNDEKDKLFGDHKMTLGQILRHSAPYIRKEWVSILLAFILISINVAINIALPYFTSRFVAVFKDTITSNTLQIVIGIALGYAGLGVADQGLLYLQAMLLQKAGQRIVYQLRMEVFTHIESMSQNQFNQMPVGSLVTRVTNYTSAVSDLFTSVLVQLLSNALTVIGVLVIMMVISIRLALYLLIFAAVAGVTSFIFGRIVGGIFRNERRYISDLNTF